MYAHCVQVSMASKVMSIDPFRFRILSLRAVQIKPQLLELRWILYVSKKVYIDQTYVVYIDIDAFCAFLFLKEKQKNNVD